ncbi:hypothetical protein [Acinetobacter seifertii]|uniref:hypothetical protein n=1 Tax=Acinetobacter seifertii TaxID=1530123 RepID=UPI001908CC6A|nr:hypothetical protein [Acinetobacter seifertii]MBJ9425161.1 hypothetical protein [Acinetobacter seifertii]
MNIYSANIENEPGVQYRGITTDEDIIDKAPINNVLIGKFKRGRLDKPMIITHANVRGMLGHEPWNPDYIAVLDALDTGIEKLSVLRIFTELDFAETPEEPAPEPEPQPDEPNTTPIKPFDYAVISYKWSESGGLDLDTRTFISLPARNILVGWNKAKIDSDYLNWGGDNTATGGEDILVNLQRLAGDYANVNDFEITLKAFWYRALVNGNFQIQFTTYKGGTMISNGVNFTNEGGEVVQQIIVDHNTTATKDSTQTEGVIVAKLAFDTVNQTGKIIKVV